MFYEFKGHQPTVDPSSFVHPQAAVTGNVIIGKNVYVGPGAAIRGDWGQIIIEDGCNVQENCTIHLFPGATVRLREGTHLGHGAIVHGAIIGRNCLIGMNSVIMDNVIMEDECIVGALSFVKEGTVVPARSLLAGAPAKIIKQVSDEMLQWKTEGTAIYQRLPQDMQETWSAVDPLRPGEADTPKERPEVYNYRPWQETQFPAHEPAAGYNKRSYTIEEYLDLEEFSELKHEYYNGDIYLMSGPLIDHVKIQINMIADLRAKLRIKSCDVFGSDLRVYVEAARLITYPDLSIVCSEPLFRDDDQRELINPVCLVEILSTRTESYDRGGKFEFYKMQPTFREYILVDSRSILVEQFTKTEQGWVLKKYDQLSDTLHIQTADVAISLKDIYDKVYFLKVAK